MADAWGNTVEVKRFQKRLRSWLGMQGITNFLVAVSDGEKAFLCTEGKALYGPAIVEGIQRDEILRNVLRFALAEGERLAILKKLSAGQGEKSRPGGK
jgi:hypothetical protein